MTRLTTTYRNGLRRTVLASALSLALFAAFGAAAVAGELPKQGTFSVTFTESGTCTTIEVGGGDLAYGCEATGITTNPAGGGFLHNMSYHCVALETPGGANGYCLFTDVDGDTMFEHWWATPEMEEGAFAAAFTGGTGKYEGIDVPYEGDFIYLSDAGGAYQIVGHKFGSYKLP